MKDGKLCVGQIGCGAFARAQDMQNYRDNPRVRCKWCCDIDRKNAERLAADFGVPNATTDFHAVVNDPEVDFVKVCTSHEAHLPIIEAAAAAGKHVFCEKPMAMEELEAYKIIRAVRKSGIKLCVDLNRRAAPALHSLREKWLRHRERPATHPWRYIETSREQYPEEFFSHFTVRVQDDTLSYRPVHLDPLRGGGMIIAETVHWLDLACWLFAPQVPVEIQAWGSARFSHGIFLRFSGGDDATILFNCGGTFDYPKELYELTCQGGLFRSELFVENSYYGMPGLDRELFPLQYDCLPEVGRQGGLAGFMEKYRARVSGLANSKQGYDQLAVDKGHKNMLNSFVDAIINDKPSPCDELSGFLSTYLAKLAIKSIENRAVLPVPVDKVKFSVM